MFKTITYKNARVCYTDEGFTNRNSVVLLHGFLENSSMWNLTKEELIRNNRVITIDLLGHGNTKTTGTIHTMEEQASIVHEVLKQSTHTKVTIVGHSMGGYVALTFTALYPQLVKKICLINATSQADTEERKKLRKRAMEFAKTNFESLIQMSIGNLFAPQMRNSFSEEIAKTKQEALQTPLNSYLACTQGMILRQNREDVLLSKEYESLMIIGQNDSIIPYKNAIQEAFRTKTKFEVLPGGHMPHIESPKELISILKNFV